VPRSQFHPAA